MSVSTAPPRYQSGGETLQYFVLEYEMSHECWRFTWQPLGVQVTDSCFEQWCKVCQGDELKKRDVKRFRQAVMVNVAWLISKDRNVIVFGCYRDSKKRIDDRGLEMAVEKFKSRVVRASSDDEIALDGEYKS